MLEQLKNSLCEFILLQRFRMDLCCCALREQQQQRKRASFYSYEIKPIQQYGVAKYDGFKLVSLENLKNFFCSSPKPMKSMWPTQEQFQEIKKESMQESGQQQEAPQIELPYQKTPMRTMIYHLFSKAHKYQYERLMFLRASIIN